MNKILFTFIFASFFVSETQSAYAMEDKENIPNNEIKTPKRIKEESPCPGAPVKKLKLRGLRPIAPQRPVALQKLNFTDVS